MKLSSMMPWRMTLLPLLAVGSLTTGCHVQDQPNYQIAPWINHMVFSSAAESQAESEFLPGGRTLQTPPEGTIPRGFTPLHYKGHKEEAKQAGEELQNPFMPKKYRAKPKAEDVARGKWGYTTFCVPCHGVEGKGDGPVSQRGMPGFPIHAGGPTEYKDGHIFHIISYGRGMMGSYASQISQDDRWKIILYVRELQKAARGGR